MLSLAVVAPSLSFLINRKAAFQRVFLLQTNKPYWHVYHCFLLLKDLKEKHCLAKYLQNWVCLSVLSS